jgi:hypothetical protein
VAATGTLKSNLNIRKGGSTTPAIVAWLKTRNLS